MSRSISYDEYIQSQEWKNRRNAYLNLHPYCEICGATSHLEVHHRTYQDENGSVLGREKDIYLMTLCHFHHELLHKVRDANEWKSKEKREQLTPRTSLEAYERSLLDYILNDGRLYMNFPKDHRLYTKTPTTVAEFIYGSLMDNGCTLSTPTYSKIFDQYFTLYDMGLDQEAIVSKLVKSKDSDVVDVVASLTSNQHITFFKDLIIDEETIVIRDVPKAILLYQDALLQQKVQHCREGLKKPGSDTVTILRNIQDIREKCARIQKELFRLE